MEREITVKLKKNANGEPVSGYWLLALAHNALPPEREKAQPLTPEQTAVRQKLVSLTPRVPTNTFRDRFSELTPELEKLA